MQWVKTLTLCICILTILSQLIPQEKYEKYVRIYSGLIFLFIAAGPILNLFSEGTELSDVMKIEFLKEEYNDLEQKADSLAELKTEQIQNSFEKESSRQILMLASAYGFEDSKVNIRYGDDYFVQEIELWLYESKDFSDLQKELEELYGTETIVIHQMEMRLPLQK